MSDAAVRVDIPDHAPHVLVVDDDRRLRDLLARFLGDHGYRVTTAASAAEARAKSEAFVFDALVLDVMMPGESGFDYARTVRADSRVPILMLTARAEPTDRVTGLEIGADDYLPKPFEPRELVARLQAVLRRGSPREGDEVVRVGALEVNWTTRAATLGGRALPLTSAEFELLGLLVRNRGRVLSRDRIMSETRGIDWAAYDRSIDVLVSRVRQKLGDEAQNPAFIRTVRGAGYCFVGAADD